MKHVLVATALLALTPTMALAQAGADRDRMDDFIGPTAGTQEITLSGTGSNDNDFEDGSFGITGSYGWYFTDSIEFAVRQTLNWANVGEDNMVNGTTRIAADYHFLPGSRLRPFVGANIGYVYGENVNETGIIGPEVGIKYFVNDTTFINLMSEYQFFFDEGDEIDDNFSDGAFVHTVGLGFTF